MMFSSTVQASAFFATLAVSAVAVCWVIQNRRKKHYVHVGKVSKIMFYPVKCLTGIEVNSADCMEKGVQVDGCDDRCYMLISSDGVLCSLRQEPRLILLTPRISDNRLFISGPEMETPLELDLTPSPSPNDKIIPCKVHTDEVAAVDCGDEKSAWFQTYLNRSDIRLVYSADDVKQRKCIKQDNPMVTKIRKENRSTFQDLVPFHLVSQESVDDLNAKLKEKVSVKNFRPNFLIEGCNAYDEDKWRYVKFSSGAEIRHLVPCLRCITTTTDPETGVRTDKEPLVALRKYRKPTDEKIKTAFGYGPLFGVYFGLMKKGKVIVGDDVFAVVEHKSFKY